MTIDENYNLIVVRPKSRKDIEEAAQTVRKYLKIAEDALYIDVLSILEFSLQALFNDDIIFSVPDEWFREEEAYYDTQKNVIFIRSDVYDKAASGDGRSRFTIMHEIAHYILFKLFGLPYTIPLEDIKNISDATLKSMDPEWQANTFTGAFLCKNDIIETLEVEEIEEKCCVSQTAAFVAFCRSRSISYRDSDMEEFSNWSLKLLLQEGGGIFGGATA